MAQLIVFPDEQSYQLGLDTLVISSASGEELCVPPFCRGLVPPPIVMTEGLAHFVENLRVRGTTVSGTVEYLPFKREIPDGELPDPHWKEILGKLRIKSIRQSLTDRHRLRGEVTPEKNPGPLIPYMARLIRGGSFSPDVPSLLFEEEHRLIAICPNEIVISRADDMLDFWIMLRTTVDLICEAWERRFTLEPEIYPRQGIGAAEIFRRLPGIDCGKCQNHTCMEFATGIVTGRSRLEDCTPLFEEGDLRHLASVGWLLRVIGLRNGPRR